VNLELARLLSRLQATAARHTWGFTPEREAAHAEAKRRRTALLRSVARWRKRSR